MSDSMLCPNCGHKEGEIETYWEETFDDECPMCSWSVYTCGKCYHSINSYDDLWGMQ